MGASAIDSTDARPGRSRAGAYALIIVLSVVGAARWYDQQQPNAERVGLVAHRAPTRAMTHKEAAASQQGQPTTAAEALAAIKVELEESEKLSARGSVVGPYVARATALQARARLTGSFDDYVAAGKALETAFTLAPEGLKPHLERAELNFSLHRLKAMTPDLDALDRYAAPDDATVAEVLLLRGDLAFYSGLYKQALAYYEQAFHRMPTLGGDLRLANYYARMGDPDFAAALLDQADSRVSGPQQQLRAFIEMRRGALALSRGRLQQAETSFRRADDIFPGYQPVELRLASMRARNGGADEALAIFKRIAARDAAPEAYDGLAALYRASGDVAEAQAWAAHAQAAWDRRLEQAPEAALGHALDHCLAFCDPVQTLQLAQRNYALRPYGDAATALAQARLANHDPKAALDVILPVLASGWSAAEAHIVASEAYALMGDTRRAEAARRAALALNPRILDRTPGMAWLEQ